MIKRDDRKVAMSIEEYRTQKEHNGRRGSPRLPSGINLYCIKYELGGYFTYSYLNRLEAEFVMRAMQEHGTDTQRYYDFNVVDEPEKTLHVGKLAVHEQ